MTFNLLNLARHIINHCRKTLAHLFYKATAFIDMWQFRHYKTFKYIAKGFIRSLKDSFTI